MDIRNMVDIRFPEISETTDPQTRPVIFVGQLRNLKFIKYQDVKHKLWPQVTEEIYKLGLESLHTTTSDSVSLYLGLVTLASLPSKCSRHNAPSRAHALTSAVRNASSGVSETVVVVCPYDDVIASAAAVARAYPIYTRKTESSERGSVVVDVEFILVGGETEKISRGALEAVAEGVRMAARIVDTPCREMDVEGFLKEVKRVRDKHDLELEVWTGEELRDKGLNGIYCVGQAAASPPAMAVLTLDGSGPTVAWVGKGIVYDTGGLSLKSKAAMPGMKRDCGGAAAVLGAMEVAASRGIDCRLHAVFCLAENAIGPSAIRPDDVYTLYSGRTVEINNTDAEGRLVLADGVTFASKQLKANIIVDVATLTGAQGVATGKYHGAALTNDEGLEKRALIAGRISADLLFPIPFAPELHFHEFSSVVADMKNSVSDRGNAQPSCAGLFILSHVGFDFPGQWLHVDMAAPVHSGERATGYGVALLTLLFGEYSRDEMIRSVSTSLTQ